jgi:hypothetical protein
MKLKRTMLAALAGTAVVASVPALADNGWHEGHDHWNRYHGYRYAPRAVFVAPPRVAYAPQVVYPAPVYYPAPRYYQAPPVYAPAPVSPGVSIRLRLPL